MQSLSALQVALHAVAPQTYGEQVVVTAAGQLPVPVQFAAAVATPLVQLALRHEEVLGGNWQAPAWSCVPSQKPLHTEPSPRQAVRPLCGWPVTGLQKPSTPATSHAWHWPVQVES